MYKNHTHKEIQKHYSSFSPPLEVELLSESGNQSRGRKKFTKQRTEGNRQHKCWIKLESGVSNIMHVHWREHIDIIKHAPEAFSGCSSLWFSLPCCESSPFSASGGGEGDGGGLLLSRGHFCAGIMSPRWWQSSAAVVEAKSMKRGDDFECRFVLVEIEEVIKGIWALCCLFYLLWNFGVLRLRFNTVQFLTFLVKGVRDQPSFT